jgi:glycosyltransferase involved in cell wall biosynthesis
MSGSGIAISTSGEVGIIVIGRNEGEHLRLCLESLPQNDRTKALYVDSGSTDGSVKLAQTMGVEVHPLDHARRFSPARARREGAKILLNKRPKLEFIQFIDGDCELAAGWLEAADEHFTANPDIAILCGRLEEREPERSVYNWLSAMQWERPTGRIASCGGIFMIRREVYLNVGGFKAELVTMEEEDLCGRVAAAGHQIVRLDKAMARHDSALHHFGQWWQRAIWGGFGAGVQWAQGGSGNWVKTIRQYLLWPVMVPLAALAGLAGMVWWPWLLLLPLVALTAYALLLGRIAGSRLRLGKSWSEAIVYAFFIILRKLPVALGFLRYLLLRDRKTRHPDPHAV